MIALLTAIVSSVLVGFIGNFLVQKWQQRNWVEQHRLLLREKEIDDLKIISTEIMKLGDARSYRTRRLMLRLESIDVNSSELVKDYENSVCQWNDSLNSTYARLTLSASSAYADQLRINIQSRFIQISDKLDNLIKVKKLKGPVPIHMKASLSNDMDFLNGQLYNFNRRLLRLLVERQTEAYVGKKIDFNRYSIQNFSTWYLFKALFQTRHSPATILGAPPNIS